MNKKRVSILYIVSLKKGKVHIVIIMFFCLFVSFFNIWNTTTLLNIYIYNSTVYTVQINMDRNKGNSSILTVNECKTILGLNE